MASVTREPISNLHERLVLKLDSQDYMPAFEKDIKDFSKKANIHGFRKGMVPVGMVKKMYGQEFFGEAVLKSVDKELQKFIREEKINLLGNPLTPEGSTMPELNFREPAAYEFAFEVGLYPEVKVTIPEHTKLTRYKVQPKQEEIENQIDRIQTELGKLNPVESVTGPENIIKFSLTQTDAEGNAIEKGFSVNKSFFVKVFAPDFQQKLQGAGKDAEFNGIMKDIVDPEKSPEIYDNMELNPADEVVIHSPVKFKVAEISVSEKHALDEDLFKLAYPGKEIKTEEEFRKAVEADIQKQWDQLAENNLDHSLQHVLMDMPLDLPEDFLKRLFKDENKNVPSEQADEQFPRFVNSIRTNLITSQIIKDQSLKVEPKEIEEEIKKELQQYFGSADLESEEYGWLDGYIKRMMSEKEQVENRYEKIMSGKILNWLKTQVTVEEKTIGQDEFVEIVKQHNHHH